MPARKQHDNTEKESPERAQPRLGTGNLMKELDPMTVRKTAPARKDRKGSPPRRVQAEPESDFAARRLLSQFDISPSLARIAELVGLGRETRL
jgi:hypothetical protein